MNKMFRISFLLFMVTCNSLLCFSKSNDELETPNIVLIFTDDQGYGDIACYGATGFETPHIDELAVEGVRFTNHYAAQPVCSASRAGLMTGCYPNRIGLTGALFPRDTIGLNENELTLPEMLKTKGYATAMFGKWHLGHHKPFLPTQHGFDEYIGLPYSNDMWPVNNDLTTAKEGDFRFRFPELPLMDGNEKVDGIRTIEDQAQLTTIYTEHAVDFIKENKKKPFFIYLAHSMPHIPLGVSDKFKGKSDQGVYGDVMMEIDWSVGEVMKALEENGLEENTIVIFTTDNGPWLNYGNHAGSAGGLRSGKQTNWEGGQRVPFIIKWPAQVPEGKVCNRLSCTIDVLPSLAEITGAELSSNKIDGVSVTELWKGNFESELRTELLYYYGKNHLNAVRKGNWKLVLPHTYKSYTTDFGMDGAAGQRKKVKVESMELYNMITDPGEHYNVVANNPEIVKELLEVAEAARRELGDLNKRKATGEGTRECGRL